jgi:hypothetical protein
VNNEVEVVKTTTNELTMGRVQEARAGDPAGFLDGLEVTAAGFIKVEVPSFSGRAEPASHPIRGHLRNGFRNRINVERID